MNPKTPFRRPASATLSAIACALVASASAWAADPAPAAGQSVSVVFGTDAKQNGITTTPWGKAEGMAVVTQGKKSGESTDLSKEAFGWWGNVDDAFIHGGTNHVKVSIEYWDKAAPASAPDANVKFWYDSVQKAYSRAPSIFFNGSNSWKTATFVLENAAFGGREEGGADFKLFSTDTDVAIRSVTIEKIPDTVPVTAVKIEPAKAAIVTGETKDLVAIYTPFYATDKGVTWTSSATPVATVNDLGQVVGVGAGTATITATTHPGGPAATCTVTVAAVPGTGVIATRAGDFLDSIGVNSNIVGRGEDLVHTIDCIKYLGMRWIRSGVGLDLNDYIELNKQTGVKYSLGFGGDLGRFLHEAREIAAHKLVIAYEGPNEPNNWGITYQDVHGGGSDSWVPVAKMQRDFYDAVKADPILCQYPVWNLTEGGAEVDNVGVQWLHIPKGSNIAMPDGTVYADYACVHNYISHPSWQGMHDNQSWLSSDPTDKCPVDGLYKEYGKTWGKGYQGPSGADLLSLPRTTTETGMTIDGPFTEEIIGHLYVDIYLDQWKQGWSWTSIYIMRDRVDEGGNQSFGFYDRDYKPRRSALYLHNFTTILADTGRIAVPGRLNYSIPNQPATVHDLLLQKASDKKFYLVVWDEKYTGGQDDVKVNLGASFGTVTVYDAITGTDPVQTLNNVDTVPLTMNTNTVVIAVEPGK